MSAKIILFPEQPVNKRTLTRAQKLAVLAQLELALVEARVHQMLVDSWLTNAGPLPSERG